MPGTDSYGIEVMTPDNGDSVSSVPTGRIPPRPLCCISSRVDMELRCERRESPPLVSRPSWEKEARLAVSGRGGVSLFPLSFLLHANNERPPLDWREYLSLENMLGSATGMVRVLVTESGRRAGDRVGDTHVLGTLVVVNPPLYYIQACPSNTL